MPASYLADGPGSRVVHGRIKDKDGGFTDYTTSVAINNVAPTAGFANGGPVTRAARPRSRSRRRPTRRGADTAAGFRYTYDFDNDGTFEIDAAAAADVGRRCRPPTWPTAPERVTVRGRIIDKDGGFTDYTTRSRSTTWRRRRRWPTAGR